MSPSPLMKPWPGRNDTPQRREGELELVLLELCLVVRASQSHPSLTPRRQYFLSHHFALDGTRCALPREARSFVFTFLSFSLRSQAELANDYILVRRPPRAYVACRLCCNLSIVELMVSLAGSTPCPTNTDALSTTRVRLDAISRLFPGYVAFRPLCRP
jgi:hypothetical protein